MATVATLETRMALNSTAFRTGMIQAANQANTSLGSIDKRAKQTATMLLRLKSAAEAFGGFYLLKEGIGNLIEAQVQLQQIHYTLIQATGSASAADTAFKFLSNTSQELGTNFQESAVGFSRLASAAVANGVSIRDTEQLYTAFSKAQVTMHLNANASGRAILALTEMMDRGVIQTRQLQRQLGFAIPGAASRFKNAVLEVTKGTDLAGKGFDKMLQDGDLVTAKFLPQMVQALTESGRGWEEAATGLNAQLNRVRKAWFDTRTEVSGGLFNDAAAESAKLLADNLGHLTHVLEALAGVATVRVGLSLVDKVGSKVSGTIADRAAALAEAETTGMRTQATLALTTAKARQLEQQAREAGMALREAEQNVAVAVSTDERTVALERLNVATVASVRANATALLAGKKAIAANLAATESENVLAAAKSRTGAMGAIRGIGSSLLGLVGGPIGAAVLAVGAVGYAFMSARSEAARLTQEIKDTARETEDQDQQVQQLIRSYRELGNADPMSKITDAMGAAEDGIAATTEKIKEQQDALDAINRHKVGTGSAFGITLHSPFIAAFSLLVEQLSGRQDKLAASTEGLTDKLASQQAQFESENALLVEKYGPAFDKSAAAVDRFTLSGIAALSSTQDLVGFLQGVQPVTIPFAIIDPAAIKGTVDAGRTAVQKYEEGIHAEAVRLQKKLRQKSMTDVQKLDDDHRVAMEKAKAGNTQGLGAATERDFQAARKAAAGLQALKPVKPPKVPHVKVDAGLEAFKNLKASQEGQLETLRAQIAGTGDYTAAQLTLNKMLAGGSSSFRKMTAAQQSEVKATQREIVAKTQENAVRVQSIAAMKSEAELAESLAAAQRQRNQASAAAVAAVGEGGVESQRHQARLALQEDFLKQLDAERKIYEQEKAAAIDHGASAAQRAVSDEKHLNQIGQIKDAEAVAIAAQIKGFQDIDAAQSSAMEGVRGAAKDFIETQQNMAAISRQFSAQFADGFSSAFASFASGAESAKKAFGSFIESMGQQLLKIAANQAIMGILSSFGLGPKTAASSGGNVFGTLAGIAGSVLSGARASGGPVSGGMSYLVGERGPEIFSPSSGGRITPNSALGGSQTSIQVNVINQGQPMQVQSQRTRAQGGTQVIDITVAQALSRMAKSGQLDGVLAPFGARRVGTI